MVKRFMDYLIRKAFYAKGNSWWKIPFYASIWKYELCVYAMKANWDSLRIKIEKESEIKLIIKRGQY